ncbi:hypothetical protein [Streptomyces sp. 3211]|uniref:hypothetical protein n=1 Tax=Streptomyces sp. 3211 TaxID=1964449 RepID=UPI0009A49022|nr:hypothetical protein [Streptomyces sp. 3211]
MLRYPNSSKTIRVGSSWANRVRRSTAPTGRGGGQVLQEFTDHLLDPGAQAGRPAAVNAAAAGLRSRACSLP